MNAVNLIPLERRRGEAPSLPGIPFLGLVVTLVLALAGTFVYVGARNQVSTNMFDLSSGATKFAYKSVIQELQFFKNKCYLNKIVNRIEW